MRQSVVKTKLKNGAISLLTKKQFVEITVTDLVEESNVARASFYRVYSNLSQVFDDIAKDLADDFENGFYKYIVQKDNKIIGEKTIAFLTRYRDGQSLIFKMLPENFSILVPKLVDLLLKDIDSLFSEGKYLLSLIFINVSTVARLWEKGGFKETREEIAKILFKTVGREALEVF